MEPVSSIGAPDVALAGAILAASANAAAVDRDGRFPIEAIRELKQAQLLGALVPAELGGLGLRLSDVAGMCHALGGACASSAMVFAMHQIQVACLLAHGLHEPWCRTLLQRIAEEQLLLASVTSEDGTGGNIRLSRCAVQAEGGWFRLEKVAPTVSYGAHADGLVLTARRDAAAGGSDQVMVAALSGDYELERTAPWDTLGMRGTCSDAFVVRVSGDRQQVLETAFGDVAETMLTVSHLLWGGVWLGIATDAVNRARAYLRAGMRARRAEAPPPSPRLATAMGLLQAMQGELSQALRAYERLSPCGEAMTPAAIAQMNLLKVDISESAVRVVSEAFAICGIAAYRNRGEFSLGRHMRDLLSAPLMIGNDRIRDNTATLLMMQMPRLGQMDL